MKKITFVEQFERAISFRVKDFGGPDQAILAYEERDYFWTIRMDRAPHDLLMIDATIALFSHVSQAHIAVYKFSRSLPRLAHDFDRCITHWWEWVFSYICRGKKTCIQNFAIDRLNASTSPVELMIEILKHSPELDFLETWAIGKGLREEFIKLRKNIEAARMLSK